MEENFENIINKYIKLKGNPYNSLDDGKLSELPKEMNDEIIENKKEIELLKIQINKLPNEILNDYKINVIKRINKVLELVESNKSGNPISRNQSMVIQNYIYGKIINIIQPRSGTRNDLSWTPIYRTTDPSDKFDKAPLVNLLKRYKQDIINSNFDKFFQLENKVDILIREIGEMWRNDNKKLYQ